MSRIGRPRQNIISIFDIFYVCMVIGGAVLFVWELNVFTLRETLLPSGIRIASIPVGNLTELEAALQIEAVFSSPITIYYQNAPINIVPDELGFEVNTAVMLAQARALSEADGGFWRRFFNYLLGSEGQNNSDIPLVADYQRNALRARLEVIARIYDQPIGNVEYDVTSLTISSGESAYQMDIDAAIEAVDIALRSATSRAVQLPITDGLGASSNLSGLESLIKQYLDSIGFIYDGQTSVASVYIMDLTTGEEINIQSDVAFSAASTSKIGIMLDLFRSIPREMNQDEAFLLANSMLCSNNSSSNRIMELYLGNGNIFSGLASVTNTVQYIGAKNTFLTAPFIEGVAGQQLGSIQAPPTNPNPDFNTYPDPFNQTTAADMGLLLNLIHDCAAFGSGLITAYPAGEYTQNECRQMLELMSANDLLRLLQGGVPQDTRISHKNGWIPGRLAGARGATTGDAGIVFSPSGRSYVISVYIWEETDGTGFDRWPVIEEISRAAWNYFNPDNQMLIPRTDLPPTAQECLRVDQQGVVLSYNYLPPYGSVDLNNINGWRDGTATTPQPLPGS
jgi:beta-lactamase class A